MSPQAAPPVSITATPGPGTGVSAIAASNEVLAGFIVWLARRRLPAGRRRELHGEAERFLRWQTGPGQTRGGARVYLQWLRQAGHSEAELTLAGEAIGRLRAYLTEQRTHHADHGTHRGCGASGGERQCFGATKMAVAPSQTGPPPAAVPASCRGLAVPVIVS
jgi:hypothetical protein